MRYFVNGIYENDIITGRMHERRAFAILDVTAVVVEDERSGIASRYRECCLWTPRRRSRISILSRK